MPKQGKTPKKKSKEKTPQKSGESEYPAMDQEELNRLVQNAIEQSQAQLQQKHEEQIKRLEADREALEERLTRKFEDALRPPPYHPGLPRKGRIYTRAPARCEDSRAIEPYRILEAGASLGLPERPEMRDTLLFSIKKDARSAKIQLQSNPHLRTHKLSPGVRRSCPPRGCYPGTTGRSYGHLGVS